MNPTNNPKTTAVPSRLHKPSPTPPSFGSELTENSVSSRDSEETEAKVSEELLSKREDLLEEIRSGGWVPGEAFKFVTDWDTYLDPKFPPRIETAWTAWQKHIEAVGEAESSQIAKGSLSYIPDPADLNYDMVLDSTRRKAIEAKLSPISLADLLFNNQVAQTIDLMNGLTVELRTLTGAQDLWVERFISEEQHPSTQHFKHYMSITQLAAALISINGNKFGMPDFTGKDTYADFSAVLKLRLTQILKLPTMFLDDLIVQNIWFAGRVKKALVGNLVYKVGNS